MITRDEKFKRSFDYISKNLHVTFDQVPRELRELWYLDPDREDAEQTGFAGAVFLYAILCTKKSNSIGRFSMSEERLSELFNTWQAGLAIAEINAATEFKFEPFKIFDIENLVKVIVTLK